jgi:hypothetical protein
MESFYLQFKEEVESYERLKRSEFEELDNLGGLGHLLIALRIALGISQRELAKRWMYMNRRYRATSETSILESLLSAPLEFSMHLMSDSEPGSRRSRHGK